ncbi:M48 family metalloprotease [Streptomyces lunalinharesii]|uniref:Peptidase M48 domain-containing protein n=1 Tax=Streptomyces lunalinharesii TaxID=333384 RepID=A0ABN3T3A9_9ACTN
MSAGTTMRFVLLLVLMVVASGTMIVGVLSGLNRPSGLGCLLAAGADPNEGTVAATSASVITQSDAYDACEARFNSSLPWWLGLAWPVLLLVVAGVLFVGLPAWKTRRGRVVPLDRVDRDGEFRRQLTDLVDVAGLARAPRFVVDPAALSAGAVVFGRNRRATVCLHTGLLARRAADPEGFRAVLLHELAHVRNRDVTIAYTTVALWWAFLALALVPYLAWSAYGLIDGLGSPFWSGVGPVVTRSLLLPVLLVPLVYLARADVLRSREVYADLAAVRWGADPRGWAIPVAGRAGGALRRAVGSFVELWRTHPRWDLRRASLDDPAELFGASPLSMFLTGAAAIVINSQMWDYLGQFNLVSAWTGGAIALVAAALITAVAGTVLCRAVAHAMVTGSRVPSGVRAGLWLGLGMAVAEFGADRVAVFEWLPSQPEALLLPVLAGAVFALWTTRCARLWLRAWRGGSSRTAMLIALAGAFLVLSGWFSWWQQTGVQLAFQWPFNVSAMRDALTQGQPPGQVAEHAAALSVIAAVWAVLGTLAELPLVPTAAAAMWVVPLLAQLARPAVGAPRWARDAVRDGTDVSVPWEAPPPLRRAVWPGLAGGAVGWAVIVGVTAWTHTGQPPLGLRGVEYLIFEGWGLAALTVAAAVAAVAADIAARGRRLSTTLVAAGTAVVTGYCGLFALTSLDGCVPSLAVLQSSCQWRPAEAWRDAQPMLGMALVLGAATAVLAVAIGAAVRTWWRRGTQRAAVPAGVTGTRLAVRRTAVGLLCVTAVGIATTQEAFHTGQPPSAAADAHAQLPAPVDQASAPPQVKKLQVAAWWEYGGRDLAGDRLGRIMGGMGEVLRNAATSADPHNPDGVLSRLRPLCADLRQLARDAHGYFRVPDPQAQRLWATFLTQADEGSADCLAALDHSDRELLESASQQEIVHAGAIGAQVATWISTVLSGDGSAKPPGPAEPDGGAVALSAAVKKAVAGKGSVKLTAQVSVGSMSTTDEDCRMRLWSAAVAMDCSVATSALGIKWTAHMIVLPDSAYLSVPDMLRLPGGKQWARLGADSKNPMSAMLAESMKQMQDSVNVDATVPPGAQIVDRAREQVGGKQTTRFDIAYDVRAAADAATSDAAKQSLLALAQSGVSTVTSQIWVDEANLPVQVASTVTLPQYGPMATKVRFTDWGVPADIQAPPADQVGSMPGG